MKLQLSLCISFFLAGIAFSQNEKVISGKLFSKDRIPQGITIINLKTEKETISDNKGEFKIIVRLDDLLVFSSNTFEYERKIIEAKDFILGSININLIEKIEHLDEVVINNYPKINAVSLGILSAPAKEYTVAERRLETAGEFKAIDLIQIPFGGMPLDPLINKITGRRKKLEKILEIEKKEIIVKKLESYFQEDYYFKQLKINEENVAGFQYFCAESESFRTVFKTNNKTKISFKMTELALVFNKLKSNETK